MLQLSDGFLSRGDEPSRIDLPDKVMEKAEVITAFLDIIYGKELGTPAPEYLTALIQVCRFADKYECLCELRILRLALYKWSSSSRRDPYDNLNRLFLLAATLGEVDCAVIILERHYAGISVGPKLPILDTMLTPQHGPCDVCKPCPSSGTGHWSKCTRSKKDEHP